MLWETLEFHLFNVIVAMVILLSGLILGLLLRKLMRRILHEIELDAFFRKFGKDYKLEKKLSSLAAYLVYFLALVFFLNQLGLTSFVVYVILGFVGIVLMLAFVLGLKDFFPNLIGGIVLYQKGYSKVGKRISINNIKGKIERFNLLEVEVKTDTGDHIFVPSYLLAKSKVWKK